MAPEYLRLNPAHKVPALVIDGAPLTENVAIQMWGARDFPAARLLPADPMQEFAGDLIAGLTRLGYPSFPCSHQFAPHGFATALARRNPCGGSHNSSFRERSTCRRQACRSRMVFLTILLPSIRTSSGAFDAAPNATSMSPRSRIA
jgi:hypothetical protein